MRPTPAKPPKEFRIENAVTRALSCRTRDFSESISLNFSINFIFLCGHQVFRWNGGAGYGLKTAFITENTADTAKMVLNNWIGKKKKNYTYYSRMKWVTRFILRKQFEISIEIAAATRFFSSPTSTRFVFDLNFYPAQLKQWTLWMGQVTAWM